MFYYHNPLTFAGGATRLPSLELPFSPAQPCKYYSISLNATCAQMSINPPHSSRTLIFNVDCSYIQHCGKKWGKMSHFVHWFYEMLHLICIYIYLNLNFRAKTVIKNYLIYDYNLLVYNILGKKSFFQVYDNLNFRA